MHRPIRSTPPGVRLIATGDMKEHLSVTHSFDDGIIDSYILAAEQYLDGLSGILGRCLVAQEWKQKFDDWPVRILRLPFPDVTNVVVEYQDENDDLATLPTAQYTIGEDVTGSYIWFLDEFDAPATGSGIGQIEITMTVGFPDLASVPAPIIVAAKMLVAQWFMHREAVGPDMTEPPNAFSAMIAPYRYQGM